jgi:hypothetical protein
MFWLGLEFNADIRDLVFILFLIDRVGRIKPLLFGSISITIALICQSGISSQVKEGESNGLSVGGVFFIFLVSIVSLHYPHRLILTSASYLACHLDQYHGSTCPKSCQCRFDLKARLSVSSKPGCLHYLTDPATGIGNWLVSTFLGQVSNKALGALGWKYNFIFIAWNLLVTLPTIFFMFKETKQRTLEEIDLLFWRGPDQPVQQRNSKDLQLEQIADGQTEEVNKA